jgi:hypothetical protein
VVARVPRNRVAREALVFLAFCAFTVVLTWPYAAHLRDAVADAGDPYFVSWVLWWDYHQTFTDPPGLFHSNLFFPFRYTLAFTENSYGIALPFFPLYALGLRPLTVHAVALFFAFASSGYGAFRLGRTLTGSTGAGWITGIAFAFVPFRFTMLSHLHYLFAMWVPLVFEALVLFARERSWKRAIWLGTAFFMSGLTCITWFVFSLVPLVAAAAVLASRYHLWRDRRFWQRAAVTVAVAGTALLPFMVPYSIVANTYHFVRSIDDVKDGSAQALHWFVGERRNHLWRGLGSNLSCGTRFPLFPGLLSIVLAVTAAASRFRRTESTAIGRRSSGDALWLGVVLVAFGFVYSLGWNSVFYRVLYDALPIFRSIRIAARGAMFAYVGIAVLAGLGAKALVDLLSRRSPRFAPGVAFSLLAILLLFELNAAPLEIVRGEVEPDAITLRLKETNMRGGIVFLPPSDGLNHRRTFRSTDHMKPLITGTSGFNSPYQGRVYFHTRAGPIRGEFMQFLEEVPTSYVVVENDSVPPERRADYEAFLGAAVRAGRLRYINRFDEQNDLYAVAKNEPEAKSEAPLPFPVETRDWATFLESDPVNLVGSYRSWAQTIYRLYVASWGAPPRYSDFVPDVIAIGRGVVASSLEDQNVRLEESLKQFVAEWVERPPFKERYGAMSDEAYVEALAANTGLGLTQAERADLMHDRGRNATRAELLLSVTKNNEFIAKHDKRSLVLLHYFGYLRRNPDDPPDGNLDGFNFWLKEVEMTGEIGRLSAAFAASTEYAAAKKQMKP